MALSEASYNVTLNVRVGDPEVTDIDLAVALPAVGIMIVTTLLLGIQAFALWFCVMFSSGRDRYNGFSTAPEILDLFDPEKATKIRRTKDDERYTGIHVDNSVATLVDPKRLDECTGSKRVEEDAG